MKNVSVSRISEGTVICVCVDGFCSFAAVNKNLKKAYYKAYRAARLKGTLYLFN